MSHIHRGAKRSAPSVSSSQLYLATPRKVRRVASRTTSASSVYYTRLEKAVKTKNLNELYRILNNNPDINTGKQLPDLQKFIHKVFCTRNDKLDMQKVTVEILQVLVDNGLKVNLILDKENRRILHLAIEKRMTEVIDFLISCNANLDVRDKAGNLVLHYSIESESQKSIHESRKFKNNDSLKVQMLEDRSVSFIEWIISRRLLQIDCKNEDGDTALHLAAKLNLLHVLPTLLKFTMNVKICNERNLTAFQIFLESAANMFNQQVKYQPGYVEQVCEKFLKKGFSIDVIDENKNTPLHYVLKRGARDLAKVILKHRKYVETCGEDGNTQLNIIMGYENFREEDEELVRLFLSEGADVHKVNDNFSSPLMTAVRTKKLSMLQIFKEYGVDFCYTKSGTNLWTNFFYEKTQTDTETEVEVLKFLLNQGCDVNLKDGAGMSPLHLAAQYGKDELIKELIKYGANIYCPKSCDGYTPLHVAARHNNKRIIKLLVKKGADVNAKCNKGQRPLHLCSKEDAVKKLIKLGAHVDVMDQDGLLPLHTAIEQQSGEAIKQLLKSGADFRDNAHVLNFSSYMSSSRYLSEHFIKLKAANLFVSEQCDIIIGFERKYAKINQICLREIEILKSYFIADRVSLYDFLLMSRDSACRHVENDKIKNLISSSLKLEQQYPMYHNLILSTYYMAVERRKMYQEAMDAFYYLTFTRLPTLCMNEIFSYLSNACLRSIVEAAKTRTIVIKIQKLIIDMVPNE